MQSNWVQMRSVLPILWLAVAPALAIDLPPGFVHTTVIPDGGAGINAPSALAWAPDGTLWIGQSSGVAYNIWTWRDGTFTKRLDLPGFPEGERGVHALAVDPDFLQNGYLWVYYTDNTEPVHNVLSRFTVVNQVPQDEVRVLEGPPLDDVFHNGGCLAFTAQETIFLAMGDDRGFSTTAQDPSDMRGNLMHIQRDGTPAPGNPFPDGVGGDPRTYAWGLRNPYRCRMQPGLDNLFIADVGSFREEELNTAVVGGNFGWAVVEGFQPPGLPGYVYPLFSYDHIGEMGELVGAAIIGGDFAPANFHPEYEGHYFFGDYVKGEIYRLELDASNHVVEHEVFATNVGWPVDFGFGPDGHLYYADQLQQGTGIGRIEYVGGGNRQPSAVAVGSPVSGLAPLDATLDGSGSSDPDMDPLTFSWDLGDGTSASTETVMKSYPLGVYDALLTVQDDAGLEDQAPPVRIVSGNRAPTLTISAPAEGAMYDAGDIIGYSASASDLEEGALDCSRFTNQVIFHHDTHSHPYLGPEQGNCSGAFAITTGGETSPDVWYELRMTAADEGVPIGDDGTLADSVSVNVYPNTANMTFETLPNPNLEITIDTGPVQAPITIEGVVNLDRSFGAVDGQQYDGRTWTWLSWDDGGPKERQISFPAVDTTRVATFGCDVITEATDLRLEPGTPPGMLTLTWQPVTDDCLTSTLDRYQVYASSTPRPASSPGSFPVDPVYTLVGTTDATMFSYDAPAAHAYFLVVAVGTDLKPGNSGHYDD